MLLEAVRARGWTLHLARSAERVVGFCTTRPLESPGLDDYTFLGYIATAPNRRGAGVGSALLQAIIAQLPVGSKGLLFEVERVDPAREATAANRALPPQ